MTTVFIRPYHLDAERTIQGLADLMRYRLKRVILQEWNLRSEDVLVQIEQCTVLNADPLSPHVSIRVDTELNPAHERLAKNLLSALAYEWVEVVNRRMDAEVRIVFLPGPGLRVDWDGWVSHQSGAQQGSMSLFTPKPLARIVTIHDGSGPDEVTYLALQLMSDRTYLTGDEKTWTPGMYDPGVLKFDAEEAVRPIVELMGLQLIE